MQFLEKIECSVSIVEYNYIQEQTHFASNFAIKYYVDKILNDPTYKVVHLCALIYDNDRLKNYSNDPLILENIIISQTITLSQMHQVLNTIINSTDNKPNCLVIEDLDEAFNIASFENYITANKLITKILRLIRKLSQLYNITCFLVQRKLRIGYNIRHVGRLVRNMVDNIILLNGNECDINNIYT